MTIVGPRPERPEIAEEYMLSQIETAHNMTLVLKKYQSV